VAVFDSFPELRPPLAAEAALLDGQKRFAHLLRPESARLVEGIQERVDPEWAALRERCD
jgi:hypothetical protein